MTIYLLRLKNTPIFEQLKIEEALLRSDDKNWCILNEGSPKAIVIGISGKHELLIDIKKTKDAGIPVIRRFSGGGTVIVDEDTVFATFIFQKNFHSFPPFPDRILKWTEGFYQQALNIPEFILQENDYALGFLKCGGNAQYLRKDRLLHHTTFLWDFKEENMSFLLHPQKTPKYRENRAHLDFICRLKPYIKTKDLMIDQIKSALKTNYTVKEIELGTLDSILLAPHRQSTDLVSL